MHEDHVKRNQWVHLIKYDFKNDEMSYFAMLNVSEMTGLSRRVCFETFVRQISVRIRAHRLDRVDPVPTVVHRVHVVVDVEVVTVTVAVVVVVVLTGVDDVEVVGCCSCCCSGHYTWSLETRFPVVRNASPKKIKNKK